MVWYGGKLDLKKKLKNELLRLINNSEIWKRKTLPFNMEIRVRNLVKILGSDDFESLLQHYQGQTTHLDICDDVNIALYFTAYDLIDNNEQEDEFAHLYLIGYHPDSTLLVKDMRNIISPLGLRPLKQQGFMCWDKRIFQTVFSELDDKEKIDQLIDVSDYQKNHVVCKFVIPKEIIPTWGFPTIPKRRWKFPFRHQRSIFSRRNLFPTPLEDVLYWVILNSKEVEQEQWDHYWEKDEKKLAKPNEYSLRYTYSHIKDAILPIEKNISALSYKIINELIITPSVFVDLFNDYY